MPAVTVQFVAPGAQDGLSVSPGAYGLPGGAANTGATGTATDAVKKNNPKRNAKKTLTYFVFLSKNADVIRNCIYYYIVLQSTSKLRKVIHSMQFLPSLRA